MERPADVLIGSQLPAGPLKRELESLAAFIAIEAALPKDIEKIPAKKILDFRAKHLEGRGTFQAYLGEFLEKREWLTGIENPDTLEARLKGELEKQLKPKVDALRDKLGIVGIDTVTSVLTLQVGIPTLVTQAATLAGIAANPIAAFAAGGALAFAKVLRDRDKAKGEVLQSSPVSYLLRTERDLAPKTVLEWITEKARRVFGRKPDHVS